MVQLTNACKVDKDAISGRRIFSGICDIDQGNIAYPARMKFYVIREQKKQSILYIFTGIKTASFQTRPKP